MRNYELTGAKEAVEEAKAVYNEAVRDCYELMCSLDFTGYLPKKLPVAVLEDIHNKLPEDVSEEKVAYEVANYYWRARCEADSSFLVASKVIEVAREVLIDRQEALRTLKMEQRAKVATIKADNVLSEALKALETEEANSLKIILEVQSRLVAENPELEYEDDSLMECLIECDAAWIAHGQLLDDLYEKVVEADMVAAEAKEMLETIKAQR